MFLVDQFHKARKSNLGAALTCFDRIDSTNMVADKIAREGAPEGTVILADSQSAGRGRNSRAWHSPPGLNLYFTLILRPAISRLHYLPYLSGLSIVNALLELGLTPDLKWPNDVLVQGKKICGILIQTSIEENRLQFALVGVGINVNVRAFPPDLEATATSVAECLGHLVSRELFFAGCLFELERLYERMNDMCWSEVCDLIEAHSSFLRNCRVSIEQDGRITNGVTAGLDSFGGLILQTESGQQVFHAGEIQSCRRQ